MSDVKVFVVLTEDRHTDPEIRTFSNKDSAVNEARVMAKEYCRFPEDYEENTYDGSNFLVINYSCESDRVSVFEAILE